MSGLWWFAVGFSLGCCAVTFVVGIVLIVSGLRESAAKRKAAA